MCRVFWSLPGSGILLEMIVLQEETSTSWVDLFDRICNHASVKNYLVSQPAALTAKASSTYQFVSPVLFVNN